MWMRLSFPAALAFSWSLSAQAAWQKWDAATAVSENGRGIITIRKDGSYVSEVEDTTHLTKRKGVEDFGVPVLRYNRKSERIELLEAATLNGSETLPLDRSTLEDKPRASSLSGFDDVYQLKFAFPAVREGSRLYMKFRRSVERPSVPGLYSSGFTWGTDAESGSRVRFVSELPLEWVLNDPQGAMKVSSEKKDGKYLLEFTQTKPLFTSIRDENKAAWPLSQLTYALVSTMRDWATLGKAAGKPFEEALAATLPAPFVEIAEKASREKTKMEKINAAMREFSARFRYQGDWRAVNGGFVPRSLEAVASSGYGDCKDFSTSMTAILRRMGIVAHVAWVHRDSNLPSFDTRVPRVEVFNHAVVAIDGGQFWLDPTNAYRPVEIMPNDIASRPALLLDPARPRLVTTASENPLDNNYVLEKILKPGKEGWEEVEEHEVFEGVAAFGMATGLLFDGKSFEDMTQKSLAENGFPVRDLEFLKVAKPTLGNLLQFEARFRYRTRNTFYRTNVGEMHPTFAPVSAIDEFMAVVPETRAGDFLVDRVKRNEIRRIFKERVASGAMPACRIASPWLDAERTFSSSSEGVLQKDVVATKVRRIPVEVLRSPTFRKLQDDLRNCYLRVGVAFQPRNP